MADQIVNEISDCFQQMAELQKKMEYLQQEKNNKAEEKVIKKQKIDPNLKVMSDWLDTYGEMIDEIERERVTVEQYQKLQNPDRRDEEFSSLYNNKELIQERYLSLMNKRKKKQRPNREQSRIMAFGNSTYFTKQYIEATHNMFLIQQKRIDELENKIKSFV